MEELSADKHTNSHSPCTVCVSSGTHTQLHASMNGNTLDTSSGSHVPACVCIINRMLMKFRAAVWQVGGEALWRLLVLSKWHKLMLGSKVSELGTGACKATSVGSLSWLLGLLYITKYLKKYSKFWKACFSAFLPRI